MLSPSGAPRLAMCTEDVPSDIPAPRPGRPLGQPAEWTTRGTRTLGRRFGQIWRRVGMKFTHNIQQHREWKQPDTASHSKDDQRTDTQDTTSHPTSPQGHPNIPPDLTVNPHPHKHPARSSSHPHAWRLIGRKGPEVARARPAWPRHSWPWRDHRSAPSSSDSASHAKTPLVLVSHARYISP